jgi:hypothetical protein
MLTAIKSIPANPEYDCELCRAYFDGRSDLLFSILLSNTRKRKFRIGQFLRDHTSPRSLFVDLGLGRAVTREIARRSIIHTQEMRDVLFTLQVLNFALAVACGAVVIASSSWLASHWLKLGLLNLT